MKKQTLFRHTALLAALLWALLALLAGCSAGSSASSAASGMKNEMGLAVMGAGPERIAETAAETAAHTADSGALGQPGEGISPSLPQEGRKLIRTVNLSVETDDFDGLIPAIKAQIQSLSGYIESSDVSGRSLRSGNSGRRHASMIVRIPSSQLDLFVEGVSAKGNVTYKAESTSDVTLKYSDLESRKKTLSVEQERIWALLEKADTLEAVIALEERLSEIRYELESMESRLRLYDNQVEYSTVSIDINEVVAFTPVKEETVGEQIRRRFSESLAFVARFFTELFVLVVSATPIWIPCLLLLALAFRLGKKWGIRLLSRKTSPQKEESGPKKPDKPE